LLALKDGFTVLKNSLAGTRKQFANLIERFHGGKIVLAGFYEWFRGGKIELVGT